jgi:hypothetical protein
MDELNGGDVEIYKFPVDDEKEAELNNSMNVSCTFGDTRCIWVYNYSQLRLVGICRSSGKHGGKREGSAREGKEGGGA